MQGLVNRVADAVLARWQNFVVELRQLAGDLQKKFICRWIFGALRVREFLPDALLHFLVELLVSLGSEDSFRNQSRAPDPQRIAGSNS